MHRAAWVGAAALLFGAALAALALRRRTAAAAPAASSGGPLGAIQRWRRRVGYVTELQRLDDQTLADMGLHRSGIRAAVIEAERTGGLERRAR